MTTVPRAKIILDSLYNGQRVTTMEVVMHRFVLAEFNTHRMFSRNSASSRAIPVTKQIERVRDDPAYPLVWASEQRGMQGGPELTGLDLNEARWLFQDIRAMTLAKIDEYLADHPLQGADVRLHKSLLNRLLEPFMWHTVVVTSVEWENFFKQRCSPLAQPEIRAAAEDMRIAYEASVPNALRNSTEWHAPYIDHATISEVLHVFGDRLDIYRAVICAVSAARCARVSYLTQDGVRDWREDVALYARLVTADPPHWSPLEHVCRPATREERRGGRPGAPWLTGPLGNFAPWFVQLRHDPIDELLLKEIAAT